MCPWDGQRAQLILQGNLRSLHQTSSSAGLPGPSPAAQAAVVLQRSAAPGSPLPQHLPLFHWGPGTVGAWGSVPRGWKCWSAIIRQLFEIFTFIKVFHTAVVYSGFGIFSHKEECLKFLLTVFALCLKEKVAQILRSEALLWPLKYRWDGAGGSYPWRWLGWAHFKFQESGVETLLWVAVVT